MTDETNYEIRERRENGERKPNSLAILACFVVERVDGYLNGYYFKDFWSD